MKVYFSSTVKAKKHLKENFELIFKTIEKLGHKNVSNFLLKIDPDEFYSRSSGIAHEHYRLMLKQMQSAEAIVFEVSVASLGIGYLVNLALEMEKPVILLHTPQHPPYLFRFVKSERLQIYEYNLETLKDVLKTALENAKESANVRFTFFITPKILQFLDFIAKKKRVPRAVYIRRLIEEGIKKEKFQPKNPF